MAPQIYNGVPCAFAAKKTLRIEEDVARARRRRRARSTTLGVARIGNMESAEANAGRRGVSPSLDSPRRERYDVSALGRDVERDPSSTTAMRSTRREDGRENPGVSAGDLGARRSATLNRPSEERGTNGVSD